MVMVVVAVLGVAIASYRDAGSGAATPHMAAKTGQAEQRAAWADRQKYVAMGSSFASGPSSNKRGPNNCGRSDDNYPNRVSDALGMRLVDVTCASSTSSDILTPSKRYKKPAQLDAVTSDTRLVTITTGGNDVGYIGRLSVQSCAHMAAMGKRPLRCNSEKLPSPTPVPADFFDVTRQLNKIVHAVHKRAPRAKVVIVDYLPVATLADMSCPELPLAPWQVLDTVTIGESLAAATARSAAASHTTLVKASQAGKEHTVCSSKPWLQGFPGHPPYHPTTAGKMGVAQLILNKLR